MLRAIRFLAIVLLFSLPAILAPQGVNAASLEVVKQDLATLDELDRQSAEIFLELGRIQKTLPLREKLAYCEGDFLGGINANYASRSRGIGSMLFVRYFLLEDADEKVLTKVDDVISSLADDLLDFSEYDLNALKAHEAGLRDGKMRRQSRRLRQLLRQLRTVLGHYTKPPQKG